MQQSEINHLIEWVSSVNNSIEKKSFFEKYPIGFYWENISEIFQSHIEGKRSAEEIIRSVQDTILYSNDATTQIISQKSYAKWNQYLKKCNVDIEKLDKKFSESAFSLDKTSFMVQDRKLSLDFLMKLTFTLDIDKYCTNFVKKPEKYWFEIGGGFGNFARIAKLKYDNLKIILSDFPETLFFAATFLKLNFPSLKIAFPSSISELEETVHNDDYDLFLIPAFFLPEINYDFFPNIDLFVNTRSFGEMHNESSRFYIKTIEEKCKVEYIFSHNRFMTPFKKYISPHRLHENGGSNQFGKCWKVLHWEVDPEFTRFPYNEDFLPRALHLIAEINTKPIDSVLEEIEIKVEDLSHHFWYRNFTYLPNDSKVWHSLFLDGDKDSILGTLWDIVRINPNEKSLDMIIKYIYLLEGKYPIEDRYFYMDLYKEITKKKHPIDKEIVKSKVIIGMSSILKVFGIYSFLMKNERIYKFFHSIFKKLGMYS